MIVPFSKGYQAPQDQGKPDEAMMLMALAHMKQIGRLDPQEIAPKGARKGERGGAYNPPASAPKTFEPLQGDVETPKRPGPEGLY